MTRTSDAIRCVPPARFGHEILIDLFTDTPIDFKLLRYFQRQLQLSVKRRQARCRGGLLGCFTHWLIYLALYRRQHKHQSIVDAITTRHSLYPLLHPFLTSSLYACVLCRTHAQWRSCGVQWRHALIRHYTWHTYPWHRCKMTTGLVLRLIEDVLYLRNSPGTSHQLSLFFFHMTALPTKSQIDFK